MPLTQPIESLKLRAVEFICEFLTYSAFSGYTALAVPFPAIVSPLFSHWFSTI